MVSNLRYASTKRRKGDTYRLADIIFVSPCRLVITSPRFVVPETRLEQTAFEEHPLRISGLISNAQGLVKRTEPGFN
jgi:hypothetical protein